MMTKNANTTQPQIFTRDVVFSGKEIIGQRENQEDYSLFRTLNGGSHLLAVLADGMGGHASGEVASRKAVEAFNDAFASFPLESVTARLAAALQQANAQVAQSIKEVPALDGMGCTLVGVHFGPDGLQWVSVGDSILYVLRGKKLIRLNADHSMMSLINDSVKSGKMSETEASNYPFKHALRSAITGGEISLIDSPAAPFKLLKGDIIILATDGILSLTTGEIVDILDAVRGRSASEMASALISKVEAKRKPKQDNTSIQVVKVPEQIAASRNVLLKVSVALVVLALFGAGLAFYLNSNTEIQLDSIENAFKQPDIVKPQPTLVPVEQKEESRPGSQESLNNSEAKQSPKEKVISTKPAKNQSSSPQTKNQPANKPKEQEKTSPQSGGKNAPAESLQQGAKQEQQDSKPDPDKMPVGGSAQESSQQSPKQPNTGCKTASKTDNCAPVVESSSQ